MNNITDIQTKQELRRWISLQLRARTLEERALWSEEIGEKIRQHNVEIASGEIVALFGGIKTEPNLLPLLPWFHERGIKTAFLAIDGDVMTAYLIENVEDLSAGQMGVLEPKKAEQARVFLQDLHTVFVPGMAFGKNDGTRLGRGKGHYDRFFAAQKNGRTQRIGVSFALQWVDSLPFEEHDMPMHALVSEAGWLQTSDV